MNPLRDNEIFIEHIVHGFSRLVVEVATMRGDRASLEHLEELLFVEVARGLQKKGLSLESIADMFGTTQRTIVRRINRSDERIQERPITHFRLVEESIREHGTVDRETLLTIFPTLGNHACSSILRDLRKEKKIEREGNKYHWIGSPNEDAAQLTDSIEPYIDFAEFMFLRKAFETFDDFVEKFSFVGDLEFVKNELVTREVITPAGDRMNVTRARDGGRGRKIRAMNHFFFTMIDALCTGIRGEEATGWRAEVDLPPESRWTARPREIYDELVYQVGETWRQFEKESDYTAAPARKEHRTYGLALFYFDKSRTPLDFFYSEEE